MVLQEAIFCCIFVFMSSVSRIRVLSDHVANQIAAGEVVERPASVLKELVENALDAGAVSLEIAWEEGGRKLLEVADNGFGMSRDDLYLALERHATSKIRSAQDLQTLESFGFRGEALPSIASVARFELHSSEVDGGGYKLLSEFGVIRNVIPLPRAKGTTVTVRDIFMQMPARRRFLKSAETEHAHLWDTITRLALAAPRVRWKIRSDRSGELTLPVAQELKHRLVSLLGEKMSRLISFNDGEPPWQIHGYISPPDLSYRDRSHLYLFVNGRPVRDRLMLSALAKAWDGFFPKGAYPVVTLFLELPPEAVDVNVHPTKAEVRFREPQRVFPWISQVMSQAWGTAKQELPSVLSLPPKPVEHFFDEPVKRIGAHQEHRSLWRGENNREAMESMRQAFSTKLDHPYDFSAKKTNAAETVAGMADPSPIRYLGAFSETYLLAEFRAENMPELWIVDQHAAHERVLYEQLFLRRHQPAIQPLLPPKIINIGRSNAAKLGPFLEELCRVGVEVEAFGEDAVTIRGMPDFLVQREPESLIEDLLIRIESAGSADLDCFRIELNAELACRAAIKKNSVLDSSQAQALLKSLINCDKPLTCPHGRPVIKKMTLSELERSFGRRN